MSTPNTVHREIADCWNRRDFRALAEMYHDGYTFTGGDGKELPGRDAGIQVARMWADAFPDGKLEVKRVYTNGDTAVAEMIGRGTHKGQLLGNGPTHKSVEVMVCNIIELREGRIFREREYIDMLSVLTQIGAVTVPGRAARA